MKKLTYLSLATLLSFGIMSVHAADDTNTPKTAEQIAEEERCTVPEFAKAIGHDELWKKHNGCPTKEDTKKDE